MLFIKLIIGSQLSLLPSQNSLLINLSIFKWLETVFDSIFLSIKFNTSFKFRNWLIGFTLAKNIFSNIIVILNSLRNYLLLIKLTLRKTILYRIYFISNLSKSMLFLVYIPVIVSINLFSWLIIMMGLLIQLLSSFFLLFGYGFLLINFIFLSFHSKGKFFIFRFLWIVILSINTLAEFLNLIRLINLFFKILFIFPKFILFLLKNNV